MQCRCKKRMTNDESHCQSNKYQTKATLSLSTTKRKTNMKKEANRAVFTFQVVVGYEL